MLERFELSRRHALQLCGKRLLSRWPQHAVVSDMLVRQAIGHTSDMCHDLANSCESSCQY